MDSEVKNMKRESVKFSYNENKFHYFIIFILRAFQRSLNCAEAHPDLKPWAGLSKTRFSLNTHTVKANMSPESFAARRIINVHISNNLKSHSIEITKPLVQAFKSGKQKYSIHLEEKKKEWKVRVTRRVTRNFLGQGSFLGIRLLR